MYSEFYLLLKNNNIDKLDLKVYRLSKEYFVKTGTKVGDYDHGYSCTEYIWYVKYKNEITYYDEFIGLLVPKETLIEGEREEYYGGMREFQDPIYIETFYEKHTEDFLILYNTSNHIDFLEKKQGVCTPVRESNKTLREACEADTQTHTLRLSSIYTSDDCTRFKHGYPTWGLISKDGEVILDMIYEKILLLKNGAFVLSKKQFYLYYGLANPKGEIIIPCKYRDCEEPL